MVTTYVSNGDSGQSIKDWATMCRLTSQIMAKEFDTEQGKRDVRNQQLKRHLDGSAFDFYQALDKEDQGNFDLVVTKLQERFRVSSDHQAQRWKRACREMGGFKQKKEPEFSEDM